MGTLLGTYIGNSRKAARSYIQSWQSTLYSMVVFGATMVVIFWASVFLYTSFYFTFIPQESITWPIHFQFKSCGNEPGICSNPTAVIPVLDPVRGSLLVRGQKYRVVVDLEMPESPVNQQLGNAVSIKSGMFLLHVKMKSQDGEMLQQSSRLSMLRYKSQLLHTISTTVFAPFLLYGLQEEKQLITIELFSQYEEDPLVPLSRMDIELASRHIELYSARLRIHAMFSGLRYFMYYYSLSASFVGIGICMVFLSTVVILSWYQFSGSSTVSPLHPSRGMSSSSHLSAPPVSGLSIPLPSKKLEEDEETEDRGSTMSEMEPEDKCAEDAENEPRDSEDEKATEEDSPVPEKCDGDDFEVVSSSRGKGVVRENDEALPAPSSSEGDSVVRQRVQSIQ